MEIILITGAITLFLIFQAITAGKIIACFMLDGIRETIVSYFKLWRKATTIGYITLPFITIWLIPAIIISCIFIFIINLIDYLTINGYSLFFKE